MSQYLPIYSFDGEYRFLSNFYVEETGLTVEHYFQAAKTLDPLVRKEILAAETPGQAKRMGRKVELRPDWEDIKLVVMSSLVANKFAPNTLLASRLISTKQALLVEGNNWHDNFWGACACYSCSAKTKQNHLGCILMAVRASLISHQWSLAEWDKVK